MKNARVVPDESSTRQRVVRSIMHEGPSTAVQLAERLDLTPAAVRRHLDALLEEGMVEVAVARDRGQRRGRGRPAKAFALTDEGREAFEQDYDDLAVSALRFLAETVGEDAVKAFARRRGEELERRLLPILEEAAPQRRPEVLADALAEDGFAASVRQAPGGTQVCQHHCPVAHVAAEFPELCEAETEAFARMLGHHVQRLATIAHGDGVCTTYVPDTPATLTTDERTTR
ncbi:helix-turn-helix transcriptional regulator [Mumia sp. DW29H23]|uniref:helix-turn-helix transcriptional regulator n=1 Tax=Mumia sp. DW29H23 TaxID=3421241 RepID=UPI003D69F7C4